MPATSINCTAMTLPTTLPTAPTNDERRCQNKTLKAKTESEILPSTGHRTVGNLGCSDSASQARRWIRGAFCEDQVRSRHHAKHQASTTILQHHVGRTWPLTGLRPHIFTAHGSPPKADRVKTPLRPSRDPLAITLDRAAVLRRTSSSPRRSYPPSCELPTWLWVKTTVMPKKNSSKKLLVTRDKQPAMSTYHNLPCSWETLLQMSSVHIHLPTVNC